MNRDQMKGELKDTAGRIQRKFGQLFGSHRQEASGTATQAKGKTQRTAGDVSDAVGQAVERMKDKLKR